MSRSSAACVKRYLELIARQPRRGASAAPVRKQLAQVEERLATQEDPLVRVLLHQQVLDLQEKLATIETDEGDYEQIEAEFVEHVKVWAERKGVSYAALREAGVSTQVLRHAGMS